MPPSTLYYSLDPRPWNHKLEVLLIAFLIVEAVSGAVRLQEDITSWMGWLDLCIGVSLVLTVAYLWQRGYYRKGNHLRFHDAGLAFVTRDMTEPIQIPLEDLRRIRWAAGNLHLETTGGEDHQLMTSFLPYDRIQEMKSEIREWGLGAGIEVVG